jgi:hypothetical protein
MVEALLGGGHTDVLTPQAYFHNECNCCLVFWNKSLPDDEGKVSVSDALNCEEEILQFC